MWLRMASIAPVLLLAGCDPLYGVESRTRLDGPVDIHCVDAALASVPGVGRLRYELGESRSTRILPRRRTIVTVTHDWFYGEGGADIVSISHSPEGWEYGNARRRSGVPVPKAEIDRFQALMQRVNQAIQARCGLPVGDLKSEPLAEP